MTGYGYTQYRRVAIETASPGELVLRLYDRALSDLTQAREAIVAGDAARRHRTLTHAQEILQALQRGLNFQDEAASLAQELNRLYSYLRTRVLDANITDDITVVDEVAHLLTPLHDAWKQAVLEQAAMQTLPITPPAASTAYAAAR